MKKIIYLENRTNRFNYFFEHHPAEKEQFESFDFLTARIGQDAVDDMIQISSNQLDFLLPFDLIIAHRSALIGTTGGSALQRIITFCNVQKKHLILFSGSIGSSFYSEIPQPYLLINSKDFYSSNLLPFLKNYGSGNQKHLIELKYGKKWRLSYLLRLQELLLIKNPERPVVIQRQEIEDLLFDGKTVDISFIQNEVANTI